MRPPSARWDPYFRRLRPARLGPSCQQPRSRQRPPLGPSPQPIQSVPWGPSLQHFRKAPLAPWDPAKLGQSAPWGRLDLPGRWRHRRRGELEVTLSGR
jgi:hypothetical protein